MDIIADYFELPQNPIFGFITWCHEEGPVCESKPISYVSHKKNLSRAYYVKPFSVLPFSLECIVRIEVIGFCTQLCNTCIGY